MATSANLEQCLICRDQLSHVDWISCDDCKQWFHCLCINQPANFGETLGKDTPWFCLSCSTMREPDEEESSQENLESADPVNSNVQTTGANLPLSEVPQTSNSQEAEPQVGPSNPRIKRGYFLVRRITNHSTICKDERQFEVEYENGEKLWHFENDLKYCIAKVNAYCVSRKLNPSKYLPKNRCGSILGKAENPANWIKLEQAIYLAKAFGTKQGLQPQRLETLGTQDAIYLAQIGTHCYSILYLADTKTCYIADGLNTFLEDGEVRGDLMPLLKGARVIKALKFIGQKFEDFCASSAAALAVEFQRLHSSGLNNLGSTIQVPDSIINRIAKIAHKEKSERVNPWKPVQEVARSLECPKCGKKLKGKSRAAFNFHKC